MLSTLMQGLLDKRREDIVKDYYDYRLLGLRNTKVFNRLSMKYDLSESTIRNDLRRLGVVCRKKKKQKPITKLV